MENSLFFNHINKNDKNEELLQKFEQYAKDHPKEQIYLITAPLSEQKYEYKYEENSIVILSPKHKIIFLDLANDEDFEIYYEDFLEDLTSLSDKFNYKKHIGRPREWKRELTVCEKVIPTNIKDFLDIHKIEDSKLKRKSELLISLLIGSINNIEEIGVDVPLTLLEKVKRNIILFDGDQTRFIYKKFPKKTVSIQGLSGTGKTELLLHKLKELYVKGDDSRIFFTCHNKTLAKNIKDRIPRFFDFMKVEKQIEWDDRLWVSIAWGSENQINSGLYSYICDFYEIPFMRYQYGIGYKEIFSKALKLINEKIKNDNFEYAFDYILIDERQDFPKEFFELCEKITKEQVYIAGDIFQDIWDNSGEDDLEVDIILNRCYRTDPRTLMFAHALGMGLFESKKLNWLSDSQWKEIGYNLVRKDNNKIYLSREPIRRFEDLEQEEVPSMIMEKQTSISQIINLLQKIKSENQTVEPDDIAIIIIDDNKKIYEFIDKLAYKISEALNWETNRAYDTKTKRDNTIFISNRNNIKGLEFPFVICITARIQDGYKYRNSLYTMLTRSFIQSYLLVTNDQGMDIQQKGLDLINSDRYIETIEPSEQEKVTIRNTVIKMKKEKNISYDEFLKKIFDELEIPLNSRKKLKKGLIEFEIEEFNEEQTKHYINTNKDFC